MSMCYYCMQDSVRDGVCQKCKKPQTPTNDTVPLAMPEGTYIDDGNVLVGHVLGAGGFGITYIARDKEYGKVALKEFIPRSLLDGGRRGMDIRPRPEVLPVYTKSLNNFIRESKLLSQLKHPNIVQVKCRFEDNGTYYYEMELLEGINLREWAQSRLPLSCEVAFGLLRPIMNALQYAHNHKTLHRDISPDNIFLRFKPDGSISPCLIDFGAAFTEMENLSVTQTVLPVRKQGFSPMEQEMMMNNQDSYTDVYALAATFYYLITGKIPPAANANNGGRLQGMDTLKPPSAYNQNVPAAVDNVLLQGLALRPENRIQKVIQFEKLLEQALQRQEIRKHDQDNISKFNSDQLPTPQSRSPRQIAALLADVLLPTLVFWPFGMASRMCILFGLLLSLLVNTVLTPLLHGTIMQHLIGFSLEGTERSVYGWTISFLYNLLRILLPLSLADEIITCLGKRSMLTRLERLMHYEPSGVNGSGSSGLMRDVSNVSDVSGVSDVSDVSLVSGMNHKAQLRCTKGSLRHRNFTIEERAVLGRDPDKTTITLPDGEIHASKLHCSISWQDGNWYIEDLGSANGTYVKGQRLSNAPQLLTYGSKIELGDLAFVFKEVR